MAQFPSRDYETFNKILLDHIASIPKEKLQEMADGFKYKPPGTSRAKKAVKRGPVDGLSNASKTTAANKEHFDKSGKGKEG